MARTKQHRLMGEINVVPYIDVMLVLLIIFMITAPLLTQGIKVDLPKAGAQPIENQKDEPLVLSIDKEGRFFLNIGDKPEDACRGLGRARARVGGAAPQPGYAGAREG